MNGIEEVLEVLENATLAELLEELEFLKEYKDKYPDFLEHLLLAEIEKRTK